MHQLEYFQRQKLTVVLNKIFRIFLKGVVDLESRREEGREFHIGLIPKSYSFDRKKFEVRTCAAFSTT